MNHIYFLSSNHAVCDKPKMLGLDTVVVDYSDELCKLCMNAIITYNDKINNYELALSIPRKPIEDPDRPRHLVELMLLMACVAFTITIVLMYFALN